MLCSVYYCRGKHLSAIKLVFFDENTNLEINTNPSVFGSIDVDHNCSTINLNKKEAIYQINGMVKDDKIIELGIFTTFGQFLVVNQTYHEQYIISLETLKAPKRNKGLDKRVKSFDLTCELKPETPRNDDSS